MSTLESTATSSSSSPSSDTIIHRLPVDLLVAIFERLGLRDLCKVEQVCRRWRDVARLAWSTRSCITINTSSLTGIRWNVPFDEICRSLNKFTFNEQLLDKLIAVKHIGRVLTRLEVSWSFSYPQTRKCLSLASIPLHCPNLEHLDLNFENLSDSSLVEVSKGCRKLRTLKLNNCKKLSDAALAQMFTYCTQLAHLDVDNCKQITGKCLEAGGPAALRRLCIQYCSQFCDQSLCKMLEHNANLTHLSMMPQKTPVEKSTVHCFVSKLKSLVDLRINVDGVVLGELLHEYVEQGEDNSNDSRSRPPLFGSLTSLSISVTGKELKDPRVISYVLANARRLKTLQLELTMLKMDDAFTRRLIGAPLEHLEIHFAAITDVTIDVLCQQLAASLRSLTLLACYRVTRQGIIKAIRELKHLRELDLSHTGQVDNSIVEAAVSVVDSDVTRRFSLTCEETSVNTSLLMTRYKGMRLEFDRVYIYKNLKLFT